MTANSFTLGYVTHQYDSSGGYKHLRIVIHELELAMDYKNDPNRGINVPVLTDSTRNPIILEWQTDKEHADNGRGWYGFHVEIKGNQIDEITRAARLLKRIDSTCMKIYTEENPDSARYMDSAFNFNLEPQTVLTAIESLKIKRIVYDPRVSDYTYVHNMIDPDLRSFGDDMRSLGYQSNQCSVLAYDERQARKRIAATLAGNYSSIEKLEQWIKGGMPTQLYHREQPPQIEPLSVILTIKF